jgi:GNAT superfamily N-acetyltransferase
MTSTDAGIVRPRLSRHRPVIRIRARQAADVRLCVGLLAEVHRTSGYPTNWPDDPAGWLTPAGMVGAWVAASDELPVVGHVVLRQLPVDSAGQAVAEVSRLFVAPSARRQGVAQALLDQAKHWATANRHDLVLEVTDNLQAAKPSTSEPASAAQPRSKPTGPPPPATQSPFTNTAGAKADLRTEAGQRIPAGAGEGATRGARGVVPPANSHASQRRSWSEGPTSTDIRLAWGYVDLNHGPLPYQGSALTD